MPANRLQYEKSPYLLQHADNPVDWYPWCDEAFEKARLEDKPVFLSIGYSTCHWCHVMAHECFEDEETAVLMNRVFVNIKVDREERPDIDAVYMKVCQLITKSGGWPLTIVMTADKNPFFAATYIPKETKYGKIGMLELIPRIQTIWQTKRDDIRFTIAGIMEALKQPPQDNAQGIGESAMHKAYDSFLKIFDREFGGFGRMPKFPSPHNFYFLLRYWKRTGDAQALHMVEHTLRNILRGGIYDQIGFGFHRYSTDERWTVPHFEKMLYDQALMAMAYIELFQATGKKEYEDTVREIFSYVLRDMTDPNGGFYCAEDADSEGIEGKFYLWTSGEVQSVLDANESDLFLSLYRHSSDESIPGMQEMTAGSFIPHLKHVSENHSKDFRYDDNEKIENIRKKLFAVREKRVRPHRDDKILTDWNGLMIAALARGAQVFDEPAYADAAVKAMDFILQSLQTKEGGLLHRFRDGIASIVGMLDDYAFTIWALLELYESVFDAGYLKKALNLTSYASDHFQDKKDGGFFLTAEEAEALPARPKEFYDSAIPSGNSVMLLNILRLAKITADPLFDTKAMEILKAFSAEAEAAPAAFTYFLTALDFDLGPSSEVVIAGDPDKPDTKELLMALRKAFVPNKVVILYPDNHSRQDIEEIAPFVKQYKSTGGSAAAYVCSNFTCSLPATDPQQMMALLK
ncbi:MAG: thioredoxin domain-containing protein [Spirochaetes bacterium]|nr:thioredoxin domain-containing protein [Spirochaetota bacterium]